jgi:hypothetical protein
MKKINEELFKETTGFEFTNEFTCSLYLSGCDLKGITLPQSIGGSLDLSGCDLKGITLPQSITCSLYLSGCDLKGITLPQSITGSLYLSGCDLKGITLPQSIGGYLDLSGAKNWIISNPIGSRSDITSYQIDQDIIRCGCFTGTLEQFGQKVINVYPSDNKYRKQYEEFINFIKGEIHK